MFAIKAKKCTMSHKQDCIIGLPLQPRANKQAVLYCMTASNALGREK